MCRRVSTIETLALKVNRKNKPRNMRKLCITDHKLKDRETLKNYVPLTINYKRMYWIKPELLYMTSVENLQK